VWAAGTWITNSRIEGRTLKWEATGLLVDEKPDDPYEWCYYYTVVAWNPRFLDIVAEPDEVENMTRSSVRRSPLISVPSYFQSERYASKKEVVVLPRGFAFRQSGLDDSHLQHIAYNLTHSESFIENKKYGILDEPPLTPPTSKAGSGYVSWETQAIFRSSSYRNYHFYEWNATLGGDSVRQLQPPFTILPTNVRENIGGGRQGEMTDSIVIGNIPFDYAVPMLTGWDLRYDFGNAEHITKVGVWLTDFEYKRRAAEDIGTLRYDVTSALYDKNKQPGYSFRHKVSILGLESKRPELVPLPPIDE